jgi:hypothetical protein
MAVNINIPSEVTQTITDGVTTTAPSENAVFDALALKANEADLALVATTGDYDDLTNKPTIPSIAGLVPDTRNLTINGVTYDLSADRSWVIAATASTLQHEVKAGEVMTKGQAVYVSSADGTNMIVTKASNATEATSSKTMGLIIQNLALNGKGYVITEGLLAGLNTASANAGDPVWLGTGGNLIYGLLNKPAAPAHLVFIGIVTRANVSNGEIFVRVQNGFELQELHNISITSVADNNLLQYDSATSLWKNESLSTAGIQPTLTSGTNIKTINGTTLLGSGDIVVGAASGIFGITNTSGVYTFYSTFTLAMAAATSGQTIEMFADVTETGAVTITLKNGVNINGNGHTYTLNTATTTNAFIDGGVAVVMNFTNITIVRKGTGAGAALGLSVSGNRIVGYSTFIKVESNNSFGITNYGGAVFSGYINGFTVTATGSNSTGIYLVRANVDGCNSVATNSGIQVIIGTLTNCYGESTGTGAGIDIGNTGYGSNCNGKSNTGYGISTNVILSNSTGYSAGNYGIYAPVGNLNNCTGISAASQGIWSNNSRIINCSAISTGAVASLIQNGVINGSNFYSSVNSGLNIFNNTTVYNSVISTLSGATTIVTSNATGNACLKNCSVINDWNNAAGHGIPANASLVVANCSIKVANTSANCLNSASLVTMKYANNSFEGATIPVNINITQGITNISDTKGNITI